MNGSTDFKDTIIQGLTAELEHSHKEHKKLRDHFRFQIEITAHYHALLKEKNDKSRQAHDNQEPTLGDYLHQASNSENIKLRQTTEAQDREIHSLRLRVDQYKSLIAGYQDDINSLIVSHQEQLEEERQRTFGRLFGRDSNPTRSVPEHQCPTFTEGGRRVRDKDEKQFVVREVMEL